MNAAARLIREIREQVLEVDDEWSAPLEGGFCWWPHRQRQDILAMGARAMPGGGTLGKVAVVTDVCTLKAGIAGTHPKVAGMTRLATLSGLVNHGGLLRLHAHAWVDGSNLPLYQMILGTVAGLQIAEAAAIASLLAEAGIAEPHFTPHPQNGVRREPDQIASVLDTLIAPMGNLPPPWPSGLLPDIESNYLGGPPCLMANSDPRGLTAEFPFGLKSSLVSANLDQRHPLVGHGLRVMNAFDVAGVDDPLLADPLALNAWEAANGDGPFLGSWHPVEEDTARFIAFVPNALQHPAAASNTVLLACAHAKRMSMHWLGDDWSETWDEEGNCRARTAVERIIGRSLD
jgi:hypothetical protein